MDINNKKIIIISGTPGTGKTTLSKKILKYCDKISNKKHIEYINITEFIKSKAIFEEYDQKLKEYIVDIDKLIKEIEKYCKNRKNNNFLIDGHLSHYLPKKDVNLAIITECDITTLKKRLKKRGYSEEKIRDNLDSEILKICRNEAIENGHEILIYNTNNNNNNNNNNSNKQINEIFKKIKEIFC